MLIQFIRNVFLSFATAPLHLLQPWHLLIHGDYRYFWSICEIPEISRLEYRSIQPLTSQYIWRTYRNIDSDSILIRNAFYAFNLATRENCSQDEDMLSKRYHRKTFGRNASLISHYRLCVLWVPSHVNSLFICPKFFLCSLIREYQVPIWESLMTVTQSAGMHVGKR